MRIIEVASSYKGTALRIGHEGIRGLTDAEVRELIRLLQQTQEVQS